MNPTSSFSTQSLTSALPLISILHSQPVTAAEDFNRDNEKKFSTDLISEKIVLTKRCVDISTQTDALSDKSQRFVNQLDANVEVEIDEHRSPTLKKKSVQDKNQKDLTHAWSMKRFCASESDSLEDGNHFLCREFCVLNGDSVCTSSNSLIKCDNSLKHSLDSKSFVEPVECTCHAATQFNCDCDETLANCTYQERIIDYENFRIIEHVIDCAQESYRQRSGKMQCPSSWQDIKDDNVDDNKDVNLACRELVAFIGESYQIINNTQSSILHDQEQSTNKILAETPKILEVSRSENQIEEKEYYDHSYDADHFISQSTNRNIKNILDDNNNKNLLEEVGEIQKPKTNSLIESNIPATSVTMTFDHHPKIIQSRPKEEQMMSMDKNSTPSVALALKALKSKLTPLAPSFHPARKKLQTSSSATTMSSSLYAFGQTSIYYQSQPPPTKQNSPQQQHIPIKLNETRLQQHLHGQDEQLQQQQIVPIFQRNKNCVTSSIEHQQHVIQQSDSLGGLPHIHLQSLPTSGAGAATTATNSSQQAQLYPMQVISLAPPSLPSSSTAAIGPQQKKILFPGC
ncbi:unnamed protein product [Ceratitis capitata]|uniref:(Mediterranean fruit fly) hypothetical protein n=1 Tax=Ceratitis capitata TaxID=7213 RepID=A0A811UHK7_CERCA|nr:unnamed protein product [Ceratitis capitata]